jgi:hypothetical protein
MTERLSSPKIENKNYALNLAPIAQKQTRIWQKNDFFPETIIKMFKAIEKLDGHSLAKSLKHFLQLS